jgi:hypothetical protein
LEPDLRTAATIVETQTPISWAAIAGGAVAAAALTLVLVAFGSGLWTFINLALERQRRFGFHV